MPREEFGACTSYLSIAAYRSDAHHLLANVMVSPITGRRSSARSGNDRAPKRLARMPKQRGSRDEASRRCIILNGLVQRGRGQRTWDARMSAGGHSDGELVTVDALPNDAHTNFS